MNAWRFMNRVASRSSYVQEYLGFPLRLMWQRPLPDSILGQVVGSPGEIFAPSLGAVYRINARDGSTIWKFDCPEPSEGGVNAFKRSPAIAGEWVFISDMRGNIYKLLQADGSLVKSRMGYGAFDEPFCLLDNRLYSTTARGQGGDRAYGYSCLDLDLNELWFCEGPKPSSTVSCAIQENRLVFGDRSGLMHCVEASSGRESWSTDVRPFVSIQRPKFGKITLMPRGLPLVIGDTVLIRAADFANLIALDLDSGKHRWSHVADSEFAFSDEAMSLATDDEHIYFVIRGHFRKLELDTSAPAITVDHREEELGDSLSLLGLVVGDHYFAGFNASRKLVAFDKNTGSIIWQFVGEGGFSNSPAWIDGNLYIGDDLGNLFCFGASG